jgi:hypothetical protein
MEIPGRIQPFALAGQSMISRLCPLLLLVVVLAVTARAQFSPHDPFVAMNGQYGRSGRLPEPNPDRSDGPLPNLQAVMLRLRHFATERPAHLPYHDLVSRRHIPAILAYRLRTRRLRPHHVRGLPG